MKKLCLTIITLCFLLPDVTYSQEQCEDDKIIFTRTVNAKLKNYFIEETSDIPSGLIFTVNGKELRLIDDFDSIKNFIGKKGKQFRITYEKIYGWLGDGCNEYERLKNAKLLK